MTDAPALSLVADIGGTNTRIALARGTVVDPGSIRRFRNADHSGLEAVLRTYLGERGTPPIARACAAVAGPVKAGRATLTNLDWTIDEATLARAAGTGDSAVINDLQAQGHALPHLEPDALRWIVGAPPEDTAQTRLVIGVGTGFNAVPVHPLAGGALVPAAEAGHANLPVRTEADLRLLRFAETAHGFPAIEDVISGRGLERIHAWASAEAGRPSERSAAEIVAASGAGGDALADEAVSIFLRLLGTVAGNLSLIHLPMGGVFLAGGVVRHLADRLGDGTFAQAFRDKGRFAGFMANFPVALVEDDYAALAGAAAFLSPGARTA